MPEKLKVLFVDDDSHILQGFKRSMRKHVEVEVAEGGQAGLAALKENGPFAVVVSDQRMPEMDGVHFLEKVSRASPSTVRMMLTGEATIEEAIDAVNKGQIFRFLRKPCTAEDLWKGLQAAIAQHHLITAEKTLLEKTLAGCVQALVEILSLANPKAFSRARRVKRVAQSLGKALQYPKMWELEVGALLSHIGCVAIPDDVMDKAYRGWELNETERLMLKDHPKVGASLLSVIPRLEAVTRVVKLQRAPCSPEEFKKPPAAHHILKVALDWDMETRIKKCLAQEAFEQLEKQAQEKEYHPLVLEKLSQVYLNLEEEKKKKEIREITDVYDLRNWMMIAEDVFSVDGQLLISEGHFVTDLLFARLKNLIQENRVHLPIKVTGTKPKVH